MQKKLLLSFIVFSCLQMQASEADINNKMNIESQQDDESKPGLFNESRYIDSLIAQYRKIFHPKMSDQSEALKALHDREENNLKMQKDKKDSHQCNGYHIWSPDENSVTGQVRMALKEELAKKIIINNSLYDEYNNHFDKIYRTIEGKRYEMNKYEKGLCECAIKANLRGGSITDEDSARCLRQANVLRWEDLLAPNFFEEQDSVIYSDSIYSDKLVLTKDEKAEIIQKNEKLKILITEYNNESKKLRDRIDILNPKKHSEDSILDMDIKENQHDQGALSQ